MILFSLSRFLVYFSSLSFGGVVLLYFTGALAWSKVFWVLGRCLNNNA